MADLAQAPPEGGAAHGVEDDVRTAPPVSRSTSSTSASSGCAEVSRISWAPNPAAQAVFSGEPADAMTRAPAPAAICTAAVPTPLAAAFTSTVSPSVTFASRSRQYQADSQATGSVAACVSSTPAGSTVTRSAGTTTNSA